LTGGLTLGITLYIPFQGMTITDILEYLDRPLIEDELWALCKEGTMALQRKKKHLRK